MDKKEILDILDNAKDERGAVPMRLVRQAFDKLSEPCKDTISRQAAIDALYHVDEYNRRSIEAIRNLPPAQSERVPGKWINEGIEYPCCSECGYRPVISGNYMGVYYFSNYCPNCGADMRQAKAECGDKDTLQGGLMPAT